MSAVLPGAARTGAGEGDWVAEVRDGLSRPLRSLSPRWFYDDFGARLFSLLVQQPEYYPYAAEKRLLRAYGEEVRAEAGRPEEVVDLGTGSGEKAALLLQGWCGELFLVDVNAGWLDHAANALRKRLRGVRVRGRVADLRAPLPASRSRRLVSLLGGTFGNLSPSEVPGWLRGLAEGTSSGDALVVGVDLVKDPTRIEAAYNDRAGLTAAFNLNALRHLGDALGVQMPLRDFAHRAFWDPEGEWIEMRLRARRDVVLSIGGASVRLRAGEEIRTELSCRYTPQRLDALVEDTGWAVRRWFVDDATTYALCLLSRHGNRATRAGPRSGR